MFIDGTHALDDRYSISSYSDKYLEYRAEMLVGYLDGLKEESVSKIYVDSNEWQSVTSITNVSPFFIRDYSSNVEFTNFDFTIDAEGIVFGTDEIDEIELGAGDQIYFAHLGDDKITGGKGNDYLEGGLGDDTYIYNTGDGLDTIFDTQGTNSLVLNGRTISELHSVAEDTNAYVEKDASGNILSEFNYFLSDGQLYVHAINSELEGIRITDFSEENNFGITFNNAQEPEIPVTSYVFGTGIVSYEDEDKRILYDEEGRRIYAWSADIDDYSIEYNGNDIAWLGESESERFYGSAQDDVLIGASYDGVVNELQGRIGDDYIQGGNNTNNLLSGGEGADTLIGGDQLDIIAAVGFVHEYTDDSLSYEDESATNLINGEGGDDYLFGAWRTEVV